MTVQLPMPGHWPCNMSRCDPMAALEVIERDKVEATHEIVLLLDRLAKKHGISKSIGPVVGGYIDDMLEDVFFELEEELGRECDQSRETK